MAVAGHARDLLDKQGRELTEGIVQELERLHNELATVRGELATLRGDAGGSQGVFPDVHGPIVISAGEALTPDKGFYPVEQTEGGIPFNWTGPSPQFSFNVAVDRTRGADVMLEGINFLDYDRQNDVKLFVDGLEVPVVVAKAEPGVTISAALPPNAASDRTYLTFLLPEALPPARTDDKRMLGLAFLRLVVTPRE